MGDSYHILVHGIPAPQGSKRHVGNGRMIESSKAVGPWREAVRAETQREMQGNGIPPYPGPVYVQATFYLPRPKGHYGTGKNAGIVRPSAPRYVSGKPDLDKLARALLDGLTEGGAWQDDAQVVVLEVEKMYAGHAADIADPARCRIVITEMD